MATEPSPFTLKVIAMIRKIPRGKVATYQQIAGLCGKPHASRGVAWILNSCAEKYKLPWHRVLSSKARIAFIQHSHSYRLQKAKLSREGVRFLVNDKIEMSKFQWKKKARTVRKSNQPRMFS